MADWNAELYSRFEKERTLPSYDLVRAVEGEPKTVLDIGCGIVAMLPIIAGDLMTGFNSLAIGGTSVIIVVGVALETVQALEAQMLMRHYKGFLD